MNKEQIILGRHYAIREPPRTGVPFQRVKILEPVRSGRWRAEWVDPNPGLVDFVRSRNIICPWREHKAFLRDEERRERLVEYSDQSWPGQDHPLVEAVDEVLDSGGEGLCTFKGVLSVAPDTVERICARAGMEVPDPPTAYTDRFGTRHLPFDAALEIARRFTAVEPRTVLTHIEVAERRYELEAKEPGKSYLLPLVEKWRASWALCRQWAGLEQEIARRDAEIERLRRIIQEAIWELRRGDDDSLARSLERKLRGR